MARARRTDTTHYTNSELLTRNEAAQYLGVSPNTLAIWSCTGRYDLPFVKVGRLAKYQRSTLDHFLQRRTKHWDGTETGRADRPCVAPAYTPSKKAPAVRPQEVEFREVRLVEPRREEDLPPSNGVLEIALPSGITLRLPAGCSPDFLASVIATLEKS